MINDERFSQIMLNPYGNYAVQSLLTRSAASDVSITSLLFGFLLVASACYLLNSELAALSCIDFRYMFLQSTVYLISN